jgi:oligopeptide/dipeptide ABC transporter ATP-binding protein
MSEKKLQVKDLTISFRTSNGKVQAVRGIDFDLYKGETLAIVGESGSGKSVTSKAVLGILAGNSIIEGGEILYDGQDLLKISEEDFHKIRGDKIAMIFQDPMSSLNPIVKIGRQLTEAMILKGKARQRESRANFNRVLKLLEETMAVSVNNGDYKETATQKCQSFDKFEYKHLELEGAYNFAIENAKDASYELDSLIFEIEKQAAKDLVYRVKQVAEQAKNSVHTYVVTGEAAERITTLADTAVQMLKSVKNGGDTALLITSLREIKEILDAAIVLEAPNFFAMGYYLTFSDKPLPEMDVPELNKFLRQYLDDDFALAFIEDIKVALAYSAEKSYDEKRQVLDSLAKARIVYEKDCYDKAEVYQTIHALAKEVGESIDKLELVKDSLAYTFSSGLKSELDTYFLGIKRNDKEQRRFDRQQAKYDALAARGKEPDEKVVPAAIVDLEHVKKNILHQIDRLIEHYEKRIAERDSRNYADEAVAMIDYLKSMASGVVHKVTHSMAKSKALKLMEEVGIPEPRIRFNQYPFEFSGGMRQRIVIAIALAADPDVLICDEPTTALDVTIQAQILELINKFKAERKLSVIFITHDLGVVANMADRIAVMYAGKIVEIGTSEEIFYDPRHPYTWALLSSMPDLDTNDKLDAIPGTPPNMIFPPKGDAFAARNKYALKIDFEAQPPMFEVSETHAAATWLLHPDAPKVDLPKTISERIQRMKQKAGGAASEQ